MKNIILISIYLTTSSLLFSQTKIETEEWINSKLSYYQRLIPDNGIKFGSSTYIEDGYLYNFNSFNADNGEYTSESWSAIKLQDIKKITYKNSKSFAGDKWLDIYLWFEKGKMLKKELKKMDSSKPDKEFKVNHNRTAIILSLDNSFLKDEMKPRMEKALKYIIKLNGGNVEIIEHKEAF